MDGALPFGDREADVLIRLDASAVEVDLQRVLAGLFRRAKQLTHIGAAVPHVVPDCFAGVVIHNIPVLIPDYQQRSHYIVAVLERGNGLTGKCDFF